MIYVYTYISLIDLFPSFPPASLPPFPLSAILLRTQCSLSLETATIHGAGECAGVGSAGDFENPMKRHGARGGVLSEVQAEDCGTWAKSGADTEARGESSQQGRCS